MFGLGFSEILVLAVLALILLGPDQLPDVARKLGRFVNDLKRTTDGLKDEFRNSGLDPSNLLNEIKRDGTQTPQNLNPQAGATPGQHQAPGPMTPDPAPPVENTIGAADISSGHVDGAHDDYTKTATSENTTVAQAQTTGKDDSGKK